MFVRWMGKNPIQKQEKHIFALRFFYVFILNEFAKPSWKKAKPEGL